SFSFPHAPPPEFYTLSLHDALPICVRCCNRARAADLAARLLLRPLAEMPLRFPLFVNGLRSSGLLVIDLLFFCGKGRGVPPSDEGESQGQPPRIDRKRRVEPILVEQSMSQLVAQVWAEGITEQRVQFKSEIFAENLHSLRQFH